MTTAGQSAQKRSLDPIAIAHLKALQATAERDRAIANAIAHGLTGYAIAKMLRDRFGRDGLSQVTVRAIARRYQKDTPP